MKRSSNTLLSEGLWAQIADLPRDDQPLRAAIAYYSKDLLSLQHGDELVVDASYLHR
ncbi:hypothetical protein [Variovorax sp. WS11]|uniref:hypothetical protein n=1 Tax=Variovorax sp. WS11 TaxID=1105204 RepID=UPI0013DAFC9D|nr:hypothetical protein [Variovorax sp. WS11]NDZ17788.1 hypothetical protein [Variovorax sp. WS11]